MVIPNGWINGTWDSVLDGFVSGATPYRGIPSYYKGTIPWVSSGELNYNIIMNTLERITVKAVKDTNLYLHVPGTFLMAITGLEAAGTRGSCALLGIQATTNQSCMAIYSTARMSVEYLFHYYCLNGDKLAFEYCQGTKQQSYTAKIVKKLPIIYPESLIEQRAIVAALSDVDGYIAALERLIAKKRNIKKGAMQELLIGKRRLPGFGGEWVEKPLGSIGSLIKESINPQLTPDTIYVEYSMPAYDNERIPQRVFGNSMHSNRLRIANNVLLFNKLNVRQRRIWLISSCPENAICSSEFLPYYSNDADLSYLMQLFKTDQVTFDFEGMSTGTSNSQKRITPNSFLEYKVLLPPTKAEQTAIATVLSDMDAEIDALITKLNKVRNIKQGMLQELLTGRIRLVDEEAREKGVPKDKPVAKFIDLPKREKETAVAQTSGHNQQFDDAVMMAGIVDAISSEKHHLGRKKVQKCLYLLRRYQDKNTVSFKKKAAGLYADEVRYRGGESIARKANYIVITSTKDNGTTFARGGNISQALDNIQSWGKQAGIKWLTDKLQYNKVDELELLTTVDMAICDLEEAGTPVSVVAIKHLIATNEEWKAKLKQQTFSDVNIAYAIRELQILLKGGN